MAQAKTKPKTTTAKTSTTKPRNRKAPAKPKATAAKKQDELDLSLLDDSEDKTGALIVTEDAKPSTTKDKAYAAQKGEQPAAQKGEKQPKAQSRLRTLNAAALKSFYPNPKKVIDSIDTLPKKVAEKARNALNAAANGEAPSVYTSQILREMMKREGHVMTSTEIKAMFLENKYKAGTASAQAQQQMVLLPALGVAERAGSVLKLKPSHPMTEAMLNPKPVEVEESAEAA